MVTGDNIQTAKAIALECGILASAEDATELTVIEGRVFRALSEKEKEQRAKEIKVSVGCNILIIMPLVPDNCGQMSVVFFYSNMKNLLTRSVL